MNLNFSAVPPVHINQAVWFLFKDNDLLVSKDNTSLPVLSNSQIADFKVSFVNYLGAFGTVHYFTATLTSDAFFSGYHTQELRSLYQKLDKDTFDIACRAFEIINWDKTHQYCGQCGTAMNRSGIDFSKICPCCGLQNYPRISPAVITAVTKENKILLARHPDSEIFSVLAGYVETGENLENAVAREIKEEVDIEVTNIRYFASQPWVFSHALMVAYTAEYHSGEIRVDGKEIEEAGWFSVKEMPEKIPRSLSISRRLIDWFINQNTNHRSFL